MKEFCFPYCCEISSVSRFFKNIGEKFSYFVLFVLMGFLITLRNIAFLKVICDRSVRAFKMSCTTVAVVIFTTKASTAFLGVFHRCSLLDLLSPFCALMILLMILFLAMLSFLVILTAQKMKYSIKDFFSKCDQIRSFLQIWSHLLKKS